MSYILAVSNGGNKGKTEIVRELANLIIVHYPTISPVFPTSLTIPSHGDFRFVFRIGRKTIAIESQGDPNTNLRGRLHDLITNYACDTIICTTRTRGDTVQAVENSGLDTIWTSTYDIRDQSKYLMVNQLKAKHILELLQTLQAI